ARRWPGSLVQDIMRVLSSKGGADVFRFILLTVAGTFRLACNSAPADEAPLAPDGWVSYSVRSEIAPRFWVEPSKGKPSLAAYQLGMAGRGEEAVDGRWQQTVPVIAEKYFAFRAEYRSRNIPSPSRSILGRVIWLDHSNKQVGRAEYPLNSPCGT